MRYLANIGLLFLCFFLFIVCFIIKSEHEQLQSDYKRLETTIEFSWTYVDELENEIDHYPTIDSLHTLVENYFIETTGQHFSVKGE